MALVIGDMHGRVDKAEAFLMYKPEEQHIFAGDYVDSFNQSEENIYQTLKLVIESGAKLVLGNHDIHYLDGSPFKCSGYRDRMANSLNQIFEAFIDRFVPCVVEDGFVITHGGISHGLGHNLFKTTNIVNIQNMINSEWDFFIKNRVNNLVGSSSRLFNIPKSRGGSHSFGGIFWADYRDEQFYDIPQVFGHSKTFGGGVVQVGVKKGDNLWALGCDSDKSECFNTATKEVEDFGGVPTKEAA